MPKRVRRDDPGPDVGIPDVIYVDHHGAARVTDVSPAETPDSKPTRSQAIADGVLFDVSGMAAEADLKFPTAVSAAVWRKCIDLPANYRGAQDGNGRLWDVLNCASGAAQANKPDSDIVEFRVVVRAIDADGNDGGLTRKLLWLHRGLDDDGKPALTVMFPSDY